MNFFFGNDKLGSGRVVERTVTVHGNQLLSHEVKMLVTELDGVTTYPHPLYNYNIEKGAYIQWKLENIEVQIE